MAEPNFAIVEGSKMIGDAYRRYKAQYDAAGKPYHCAEREYYSTGGITFTVQGQPVNVTGNYPVYILKADANQKAAQLFAYKVGDPMTVANITTSAGSGTRNADVSDTNLLTAYQTNDEDFAIRGIGFNIKGFRIEMTRGDEFPANPPFMNGTDVDSFGTVITTGSGYLDDPGSYIMPPQVDSPLTLQDAFGRPISKRLRIREVWDTRASDDVALARRMGPGGSESYLRGLGEPTTYNFLRLDPGLMWNRQNADFDNRFNLECSLQEDIWIPVAWTQALVDFAGGEEFGTLLRVHVDYQLVLVGNAFYYPSANA